MNGSLFVGTRLLTLITVCLFVTVSVARAEAAAADAAPKTPRAPRAAEILPADTLLFAALKDVARLRADWKETALAKILAVRELAPFVALARESITKGLGGLEKATQIKPQQLAAAFSGQVAFAVLGLTENPFGNEPLPQMVLIAPDSADKPAQRQIARSLTEWILSLDPNFEEDSYAYNGTLVQTVGVEGFELCTAHVRGLFLCALPKSAMDRLLDGLGNNNENKKRKVLAENPAWRWCRRKTGDPELYVHMNLERLFAWLTEQGQMKEKDKKGLLFTGLDQAEAVAWGLHLQEGGIKDTVALALKRRTGLMKMLPDPGRPVTDPMLRRVPSSALAALAFKLDLRGIYNEYLQLVAQTQGDAKRQAIEQTRAAIEQLVGIDLEQDLFQVLDGEIALTLSFPPAGGFIPDVALLIELKQDAKPDALLAALRKLKPAAAKPVVTFRGTEIYPLPWKKGEQSVSLAYAVRGDVLLLASDSHAAKRALAQIEAAADGRSLGLLGKSDILKITRTLSGSPSVFWYLDLTTLFSRAYSTAMPLLAWNKQADQAFEPAQLPLPETITRHLFGYYLALTVDQKGATLESFSPVGGTGMLMALAVLADQMKKKEEKQPKLTAPTPAARDGAGSVF